MTKEQKENRLEKQRRFRKLHPKYNYEHVKQWRKENPEKRAEQQVRYTKKHPEAGVKSGARWRKSHPEVIRAKKQRRRARKAGNGGMYTAQQWIDLKLFYGSKCLCCRRRERTLARLDLRLVPDHVISISKGGSNDISNIQPLCHGKSGCNNKKGTKHVDHRIATALNVPRKKGLERRATTH